MSVAEMEAFDNKVERNSHVVDEQGNVIEAPSALIPIYQTEELSTSQQIIETKATVRVYQTTSVIVGTHEEFNQEIVTSSNVTTNQNSDQENRKQVEFVTVGSEFIENCATRDSLNNNNITASGAKVQMANEVHNRKFEIKAASATTQSAPVGRVDNGNDEKGGMGEFVDKRWDAAEYEDEEADLDNSSARLFERSRIKALAGCARG